MALLCSCGLLIISACFLKNEEHFTFQSKWMVDRLLDRDENNKVYQGGLISDVTYQFFENGYLLTMSMFCAPLQRWVPVQLSWIRGLSVEYYKLHFMTLLRQFKTDSFTPAERKTLARQIVDFSVAQRNGFINAYMEVFGETDREEALRMVKGWHQHFKAQVT